MATRKPDWAQRAVEVEGYLESGASAWIPKDVAAALLRAHHRKVKQIVKQAEKESLAAYSSPAYRSGVEHAIYLILYKLKELEQ